MQIQGIVKDVQRVQTVRGFEQFLTRIRTEDGSSVTFMSWRFLHLGQPIRVTGKFYQFQNGLRFGAKKIERLCQMEHAEHAGSKAQEQGGMRRKGGQTRDGALPR